MSMVAGRLAVQEGANYLKKKYGGYGVLLGGVPGVERARVTIIGGGVVGTHAAKMALGLGAEVTAVDIDTKRLEYLDDILQGRAVTLMSNHVNLSRAVQRSNLVIGAVLIPGAKAPRIVTEEMVKTMKSGSVIVDVAVDQGGCVEGTRPTTHDDPVYTYHGVI